MRRARVGAEHRAQDRTRDPGLVRARSRRHAGATRGRPRPGPTRRRQGAGGPLPGSPGGRVRVEGRRAAGTAAGRGGHRHRPGLGQPHRSALQRPEPGDDVARLPPAAGPGPRSARSGAAAAQPVRPRSARRVRHRPRGPGRRPGTGRHRTAGPAPTPRRHRGAGVVVLHGAAHLLRPRPQRRVRGRGDAARPRRAVSGPQPGASAATTRPSSPASPNTSPPRR